MLLTGDFMKVRIITTLTISMLVAGCANKERPYNYQIDYPVDAARLSLSGDVVANIDCDYNKAEIISDSSNGIFSRHIQKRLSSICYKKSGKYKTKYQFIAMRDGTHDILSYQPNRNALYIKKESQN